MDDDDIRTKIGKLVAKERELRSGSEGLTEDDRVRLRGIEEELDQCWDLLRQRQAREEFGQDPDQVSARPVSEVESYQQ
ncbi:DUF2630 family protein [soil metagenome]